MNVNAEELLLLLVIAVVVIGPQRLPEYAEQLGKLVRSIKQTVTGATATIRDELGDDFNELDLSKLDPRQYDPRRIVREALLEDISPKRKPVRSPSAGAGVAAAVPADGDRISAADALADVQDGATSRNGAVPFDDEAT